MGGTMLAFRILIAFAPLLQSASSTMRDAKFVTIATAENLVYSDHLLFDSPARSALSCAEQCAVTENCLRFTYMGGRGRAGRCRGHSTHFPSGQGTVAPVATAYIWAGAPRNVALHQEATQISTLYSNPHSAASKAVDGNPNTNWRVGYCAHTGLNTADPAWWQVDLGGDRYDITSVIITNRADCCGQRLHDFDIHTYTANPVTHQSAPGTLCSHYDGPMGPGVTEELVCSNGPIRGRFLRVTNGPGDPLTLCEVQVMAVWA